MTTLDSVKLNIQFSILSMQQDLQCLEQSAWLAHFVKDNYEGDWRIIPLRGPKGEIHPIRMAYSDPSCTEFEDTPFLNQCNYLKDVLNSFPFTLYSVRLMSLAPGAKIKEHRDHELSLEQGTIRLHIPIISNAQVEFYLKGKRVNMLEGECWYLNLSKPHWVYNGSQENRIHLVIDAPVNLAVEAFLSHQMT